MSKQDRQGARTPADVERRMSGPLTAVEKTATDAHQRATQAEKDLIDLKNKKITIDQLDIEGQEINVKVNAANITGLLTAEQINADDIKLQKAIIGGWHLEKMLIDVDAMTQIEEYALYSDEMYETRTDIEGYERTYTYRVYLTAKGVYVKGRYNTAYDSEVQYYASKSWLEICGG